MRIRNWTLAVMAMATVLASGDSRAAETPDDKPGPDFFPFVIPWDGVKEGTAVDVSGLNHTPAGKFGRVVVRDGHFVFEGNGQRVRFFATNVAAESAYPQTKEEADAFAQSLARRGINLVRLHHLDNGWAIGRASIWDKDKPGRREFDPVMLDRLEYLISRLIAHGIYVNVNLKVGKELTAANGFDEAAIKALRENDFPLQKRVDYFDPTMIAAQKDYARKLLTHVNPHTGRSLVDEPAVAIVEVNNENSLISLWPGQPFGSGLDKLPEPFATTLKTKWNAWLKKQYADEAAVLMAWNRDVESAGPSVLPKAARWATEQHDHAEATFDTKSSDEAPAVVVKVTRVPTESWHVQANIPGLTLEEGKTYTVSFEARSDRPRTAQVGALLDIDPWRNVGLSADVRTTEQWQRFDYTFTAQGVVPGHVRVGFSLGSSDVPFQAREFSVRAGGVPVTFDQGESLARGNVRFPFAGSPPTGLRAADALAFLVDVEANYAKEMRAFLRDLGVKSPMMITQVQWGGTAGYSRERDSDLIDTHAYVHHPEFAAGQDWSPDQWKIKNQSDLTALAETGRWELGNLALYRQAGKPFSVSEFDEPAPSDYAAETLPMLAAAAISQDWDAVYTFCMPGYGGLAGRRDAIDGFFDHLNHPAKAALYPFAAVTFRSGASKPFYEAATLRLSPDAYEEAPDVGTLWRRNSTLPDTLTTRVSVGRAANQFVPPQGEPSAPDDASAKLTLIRTPHGPVMRLFSSHAAAVFGFLADETTAAGSMSVTARSIDKHFGVVALCPLDNQPIETSARLLLTAIGRAENVGMGWNAERTSVGSNWGRGPVHAQGLTATVSIARTRPATVYPLNPDGTRRAALPVEFNQGRLVIPIKPTDATVWYELAE